MPHPPAHRSPQASAAGRTPRREAWRAIGVVLVSAQAGLALAATVDVSVTDASGSPLADAVVAIEVKGAKTTAAPGTQAEMGQRSRSFVPSVLAVQTGTAVLFPNFDTVRHHVYSFSAIRAFEIKLYAGTPSAPVVFDKAGTAVLGCNIHDRMTAYVHVVNTPHFAKTSATGSVHLDVPPGDHTLQVWHPSMADAVEPKRMALKVAASGNPRTAIALPPAGR